MSEFDTWRDEVERLRAKVMRYHREEMAARTRKLAAEVELEKAKYQRWESAKTEERTQEVK